MCEFGLSAKASRGGGGGGSGGKGSGGSKSGKSSSVVAIPRSKSKGGGGKSTGSMRSFGGGLVYNLFREMKQAFGSELEALTLQLTRPSDAPVPASSIEELVQVFNVEYENPQLTVSLFAKFSRKLCEQNVYTKIKSLLCLHKLMQGAEDKAACAMMQCVRTLRSEMDAKVGLPFFSNESIEQSASVAANVGELEAVELTIEYASYVFDLIEARGDKISTKGSSSSKNSGSTADRAEALLSLIEQGQAIEGLCKQRSTGPLVKQCLDSIKTDRNWALKNLQYVSESGGADDEKIDEEIAATLALFDVKTKKKEKKEKGGSSGTSSSSSSSSSSFFEQPRKAIPKKAKTQIDERAEEKKQETVVVVEEEEEEEEEKGKTTQKVEEKEVAPQEVELDNSSAKAAEAASTVTEPVVENAEVEGLDHAASLPAKKSTRASSPSSSSSAAAVKKTKTKAKVPTASIKKKKGKSKGKTTGTNKKTKKH